MKRSSLVYVDDFSTGLRTDTSADKLPEGALVRAENVRLLPEGGFVLRGGSKVVSDWDPGTGLKILNMEVLRELNVMFVNSGTKIFVAKDEESSLYTVGLTLETGLRCALQEYDGAMKYTNGADRYGSIVVALVKTQFTDSDTRIELNDGYGAKFSASGTVYVKGNAVSYTKALGPTRTQTYTADSGTDTFTANAHGLANDDLVVLSNSGGAQPTGLNVGAEYHVVNVTTNTFQLSSTQGGSAIDISDNGSGTNSFHMTQDTLTGCTIPSGTYEVNHVVTQTSQSATAPFATILESQFEKMMAAGVKTARHAIYYSVTANTDTPANIDDFSSTGADQELYGKYGRITAMKSLLTKLYVAKDKGIETWEGIDADGIPIRSPFTDAYGVVNDSCMIVMGDKLALFTNQRRFKTIEPDSTGANPEPVINPYFDRKITGTLAALDADQSDSCMGYNESDELLRATVFENNARKTIVFDTLTNGFTVDTGYVPSCWVEYKGRMYFGSAVDDIIYQAEEGYQDGVVSPRMDVLTPIHYVGDRRRKAHVKEVYLTGIIKTRTTGTVTIYCDGAQHRSFTLDGTAGYVSQTQARPFGRQYLGRDPLGRSEVEASESDGFLFSVPIGVNIDCRNIQLRFECQGTGHRLQITSYEVVEGDGPASDDTQEDSY